MNLPNLITLSRLLLTLACFVCLELIADPRQPSPALAWTAFALFLVAAVTDFFDGWLARRMQQVTAFGRVADPFADKVLICGTLIILLKFPAATAIMQTWFVVVLVAREFLVTSIRGVAEAAGIPFPAERLGKYKMVAQCVLACALLTLVAGTERFEWLANAGLWITLVLTLWSGWTYAVRARKLLA